MARRPAERGEGRAGFLIALVIGAMAVFAAVKFVPVYVSAYDLEDTIRRESTQSSLKTDEQITAAILAKGAEKELPITKKDIAITRTHAKFKIKVAFDVPIDLALFTYNYHYEQSEEAPLF